MQASYLTYIANIESYLADKALELARKDSIGLRNTKQERNRLTYARLFINAITSYLSGVDDNVAFCDSDQAQIYVDHINMILKCHETYN